MLEVKSYHTYDSATCATYYILYDQFSLPSCLPSFENNLNVSTLVAIFEPKGLVTRVYLCLLLHILSGISSLQERPASLESAFDPLAGTCLLLKENFRSTN
jgi:hypothetical protein